MDKVFGYLDEALSMLLPQSVNSEEIIKVKELLECVYWRKGALCYMYCHTAYNDQETFLSEPSQQQRFLDIAKQGL